MRIRASSINLFLILFLLLSLLSGGVFVASKSFLYHTSEDGEQINRAGSLRYRAYKMLSLVMWVQAEQRMQSKRELQNVIDIEIADFEQVLAEVGQHTGPADVHNVQAIQTQYRRVRDHWYEMIKPLLMSSVRVSSETDVARYQRATMQYVEYIDAFVQSLSTDNHETIESYDTVLGLFAAFFALFFLSAVWVVRRKVLIPVGTLRFASRRIRKGDISVRVAAGSAVEELEELGAAFNDVAVYLGNMMRETGHRAGMLSGVNQSAHALAELNSTKELLARACRDAVTIFGADAGWVSRVDVASQQISGVAFFGFTAEEQKQFSADWSGEKMCKGTTCNAIRYSRPMRGSIGTGPEEGWDVVVRHKSFRTAYALPLTRLDESHGAITLYSCDENAFKDTVAEECVQYVRHISSLLANLLMIETMIYSLARAAEVNDEDTGNHILRVGEYCAALSREMGLPEEFAETIRIQAVLHDVGKMHVPASVLKKPGALSADEWGVMKQHSRYGAKIIGDHPALRMAKEIALTHHERFDGSGYPFGLKGDEIPVSARIIAIADQYDALRTKRVYKPAFTHERACAILLEGDGRSMPAHFDPEVLAAFDKIKDNFDEIFQRLA